MRFWLRLEDRRVKENIEPRSLKSEVFTIPGCPSLSMAIYNTLSLDN